MASAGGAGGEQRRQVEGEVGVDQRPGRDQVGAHQRQLAAVVEHHDRTPADLRAGARGRGNGDHGRQAGLDAGGAALDHGVLGEPAALLGEQARRLGEVHRRAAAHGDDAVGAARAELLGAFARRLLRRVGGGVGVDRGPQLVAEAVRETGEQTGGDDALVRDDERAGDAELVAELAHPRERAVIHMDRRQVVDRRHRLFPRLRRHDAPAARRRASHERGLGAWRLGTRQSAPAHGAGAQWGRLTLSREQGAGSRRRP